MSGGPRRLRLLCVDDERGASTRYRLLAHRPALDDAGFRTEVRFPLAGSVRGPWRRVRRAADLIRDVADRSTDPWLVHRKLFPPPFAGLLPRGRPFIFDLDDAIDLPPPGRDLGPRARARYRLNFEATVGLADLVLCGNRELASRLPHDRYELLATPIDAERFHPEAIAAPTGPVVGWVGHSDNLAYLEALADPLRELSRRHPQLRVIVVADQAPRLPGLSIEFRRWRLADELSCFDGIGVGLMPLEDTPWARAKCAFKAIQYMALGIPTIASPVGMNVEVIENGVSGFLPRDGREWLEALDALLSDNERARRIGSCGRLRIEREYALRVISRRLIEILRTHLG
jgi:glycosyltransferase involved in cell wall biosynthesis